MAKRIFLFVATNIAILLTVSVVLAVLQGTGIIPPGHTGGLMGLVVFCLVWGMGGAFVSLALSRVIAKWATGVKLVDGHTGNPDLDWLYNTIRNLSQAAGLPMPQVGFYESPEVNAFATGPTRSRSLVAVSSGLMRAMRRDEIEGVLGHELAHIRNGDMVTMTLIQGVVNAFVLFLSHIIATLVRTALRSRDSEDDRPGFMDVIVGHVVFFAAQIVFGLLGSMITAWFSRHREFRADGGGAALAGRGSMIAALRRLQQTHEAVDTSQASLATLKISGRGALLALISTHPPLEDRIRALEMAQ